MKELIKKDILFPELSYKIIGILYEVYNELGYGFQEKYYEKATAKAFGQEGLNYREQMHVPLEFKGEKIGDYFLDFLVDDKIVLELKKGDNFSKKNIDQVYAYLKAKDLKLGIIAQFTSKGLKFKRIVNIK
ncbi:MAG: GxxExxY protein [Candidatus Paceibacterota bacterium]